MNLHEHIHVLEETSDLLVIVYKEARVTNPSQVNDFFDYLTKLSSNRKFHIIIDLSNTNPPSAEVRSHLRNRLKLLDDTILSYKVYVGSNVILKIAARFVGASIGLENFTISNSIDSAITKIRNETSS